MREVHLPVDVPLERNGVDAAVYEDTREDPVRVPKDVRHPDHCAPAAKVDGTARLGREITTKVSVIHEQGEVSGTRRVKVGTVALIRPNETFDVGNHLLWIVPRNLGLGKVAVDFNQLPPQLVEFVLIVPRG